MNFCVKCGNETDITVNGLCLECFLDGRKLISLPHHVDVSICANCGDIGHGDFWVTKDHHDAVLEAAKHATIPVKEAKVVSCEATSQEQEPFTFVVEVNAVLDISGQPAEDSASTIVRLKNTVCKRCSKQLGNYYEAILQIRAGSKDVSQKILKEAFNRVENLVDTYSITNRQLFITKSEEVQGGIDIYLSSISLGKTAAKELADTYCAETKEAFKLIGLAEDGRKLFRINYLVRLPDFHVGDVIIFEGRYFKLIRVSTNGAKVIDILNHRERAVKRTDIPEFKVHTRSEDLKDAVVVNKGKGEIQILHPSNYSTLEVRIPEEAEIGDTVKVVDIDDVLYYVP